MIGSFAINKSHTCPAKIYWSMIASTTINSYAELDYQPKKRYTVEKSKTWRLLTSWGKDLEQIDKQKPKGQNLKEKPEEWIADNHVINL